MSRAERRAYKRLTKNQDPYALPTGAASGARARAARPRPRRARERGPFVFLSGRFLAWAIAGALLAFLVGFSIAWPTGLPFALYAGLAAGAAWVVLAIAFRFIQRRMAGQQVQQPPR
jgi:hypothetical protein